MPAAPGNGRYRILAEINMIPFIDVALVLLIIFMVMTPFLVKSQIKINLPKSKAADSRLTREDALQVQVQRNGVISIDGQAVEAATIETVLRRKLTSPETQPLIVEADKDVPFQHVVVVLDAAKRIGAAKLGVCVKQETERASGTRRK
jgi:biopolymer transport protein ExbD